MCDFALFNVAIDSELRICGHCSSVLGKSVKATANIALRCQLSPFVTAKKVRVRAGS